MTLYTYRKAWRTVAVYALLALVPAIGAPITTPEIPTIQDYFGVKEVDLFQWLESKDDPKLKPWLESQARHTRSQLDSIPTLPLIRNRLHQWLSSPMEEFEQARWTPNLVFVLARDSYFTPAKLLCFPTASLRSNALHGARVLVDPLVLDASGATHIRWISPSPDGAWVAILQHNLATGQRQLRIWELSALRFLPDELAHVDDSNRAGSVAWDTDGKSFFYTRYPPAPNSRTPPMAGQILRHALGTDSSIDTLELSRELPANAALDLKSSSIHRRLIATARTLGTLEAVHWMRNSTGQWTQFARVSDRVDEVEFGRDPLYVEAPRNSGLYLVSRDSAPRGRVLRVPLDRPALSAAQVVVPESRDVLIACRPSASGLYVSYLKGGSAEFRFYDFYEKEFLKKAIVSNFGAPSTLKDLCVTRGDEFFYGRESYVEPAEWTLYDPNRDRDHPHLTPLYNSSPVDFTDIDVDRVTVRSADGTRVPLYLVMRRGTRQSGENPTLLALGPGGGTRFLPNFDFSRKLWLDQGNILAFALVRGGGELGVEGWASALDTGKTKCVQDVLACARFLVESNYTRPDRLALQGIRFGALTAAAAIHQRPEQFRVLRVQDGAYDLLRGEQFPMGGTHVRELGSMRNREHALSLLSLSPYRNAPTVAPLPAVFLGSSSEEGFFSDIHSRKLAARLQLSAQGARPVLLAAEGSAAASVRERMERTFSRWVDEFAFLFDQLGASYSLVERGPWSGAVTPTSVVVKARLAQEGMNARLRISQSPLMQDAQAFGLDRAESNRHHVVQFRADGLSPGVRYYYALEVNGRLDYASRGQFRTFPVPPSSFQIAFASCARTASTSKVFDRIREHDPLIFLHTGDFHYLNITTNRVERFRSAYDLVLSSPQQSDLYRSVPLMYVWDDHDYGGNNSNRKASSHQAARQAYDEYVPHYPLPAGGGDQPIYQSFSIGRVKFIVTDLRSERDDVKKLDDSKKTMMGERQKEWFKQELLKANGVYPLICWVCSVPWLGNPGTNYYAAIRTNQYGFIHHTNLVDLTRTNRAKPSVEEDHWSVFATERRELADFIQSNHIQGLCILHGDSHMLAADDGSHSDFSTGGHGARIPVMCAGPLDQTSSIKGGPYSQGIYRVKKDEGAFGILTVTDRGHVLDVKFSGRNDDDQEKISLNFPVPASPVSTQPN